LAAVGLTGHQVQLRMLKLRYTSDTIAEVGIDEAGRGPLWGPMMAAVVLWPSEETWTEAHRELIPQIKDSKKVPSKKRDKIAQSIKDLCISYGIGSVSAAEIDTLGATRANQLAFRRAITEAAVEEPKRLLIDGILPLAVLKEGEEQQTIIEGDANYLSIAAASILAKVAHDAWVVEWCKENIAEAAKYDLLSCKGYGTAKHRAGILKYGYTEQHRRLYLRKLVPDIVVSRAGFVEDD
jgi:ribonuclease HII